MRARGWLRRLCLVAVLSIVGQVALATAPPAYGQGTPPAASPTAAGSGQAAAPTPAAPAGLKLPDQLYRTRVSFDGAHAASRLKELGVTVLNEATNGAIVVATSEQLVRLARLGYRPEGTDEVGALVATLELNRPAVASAVKGARAGVLAARGAGGGANVAAPYVASDQPTFAALPQEQRVLVAAAAPPDADNDGLTDTQEAWWCTDPANPRTRGLQHTDGEVVRRLLQYVNEPEKGDNRAGAPFRGWPMSPTSPTCTDADQDSIPDQVEAFVLGTNPNRESTSGDKFDDGQKVFGITYCPGGSNSCGYGALPRNQDAAFVQSSLPGFVQWPAKSPFVAAFPKIEVAAVPGTIKVQAVSTITNSTGKTTTTGEEHTYGTSETKGVSDAVTNTQTWSEWQEVGTTTALRTTAGRADIMRTAASPREPDSNLFYDSLEMLGGIGGAIAACGPFALGGVIGGAICGLAAIGAAPSTARTIEGALDRLTPDQGQQNAPQNLCLVDGPACFSKSSSDDSFISQQSETTSAGDINRGSGGNQYRITENSQVTVSNVIQLSAPSKPQPTRTETTGRSVGGSLSSTHTEYQEYTVSRSETKQFSVSDSWETATAVDSAHAGDLAFQFTIVNTGSDYAAVVDNIAFNIQIGKGNKAISLPTYAVSTQDLGTLRNVFPGQSNSFTSRKIPLSLEEMRAIDEGNAIYITLEDVSYGADQTFYQSAVQGGMDVVAATTLADGVTERLARYVLPVYPDDKASDVLCRYFRCTKGNCSPCRVGLMLSSRA